MVWLNPFLEEDKNAYILESQYRGCWWLGDARNHGISKNGTKLDLLGYSGFITRKVSNCLVCSEYGTGNKH